MVSLQDIVGNVKLAREMALTSQYETAVIYYQGVVQQIHRLLQTIQEPTRKQQWQQTLDEMTEDLPDTASIESKTNLVTLLMLIRVPRKTHGISPAPLWCSHRKMKNKKSREIDEDDTESSQKPSKKKKSTKGGKIYDHRKSRYAEVVDQTLYGGPDQTENDDPEELYGEDEGLEIEVSDTNDNEENMDVLLGLEEEPVVNFDGQMNSDDEMLDDEEFKKGQKVKKPRRDRRAKKELEEGPADLGVNEEFMEAVKRGPVLKPVTDKDRLLPKGLFPDGAQEESDSDEEEEEEETGLDREVHKGPVYKICYVESCEHLTNVWGRVMKLALNDELYKKCLVFIPEHVMDHLQDPLKLTDFFMESFNFGGAIGLMAMRGVFLLITKHNLHYPEFYPKLYTLLDPMVCSTRYKPRFFLLLNVFLSSTHLPEYIAAAFVKVLSRLLHYAPQHSLLLILKMMNNILSRFPSLSVMYDRQGEVREADPYVACAEDLKLTRASESSLWEVATTRHRSHPKVYKAGRFIERIHTPEEIAIKPSLLELDYEDLDETTTETAYQISGVTTNFTEPQKLLSQNTPFAHFLNTSTLS